jgi:hypothetical protein
MDDSEWMNRIIQFLVLVHTGLPSVWKNSLFVRWYFVSFF